MTFFEKEKEINQLGSKFQTHWVMLQESDETTNLLQIKI